MTDQSSRTFIRVPAPTAEGVRFGQELARQIDEPAAPLDRDPLRHLWRHPHRRLHARPLQRLRPPAAPGDPRAGPVRALPATIATGGALARALEGAVTPYESLRRADPPSDEPLEKWRL